MGEGLGITQRQLHHQKHPHPSPSMGDDQNPGVHCNTCRQLHKLEGLPFLDSSLVSALSVQLRWLAPSQATQVISDYLSAVLTASRSLEREGPNASGQFQELPEASECFLSEVARSLPLEQWF